MNERKAYYCERCKKIWDEDEIEINSIEHEPFCPRCGDYLEGLC